VEQQLLRIEEAARVLGLGRSKTYELVRAGTLPVVHIGSAVRVPAAALERFIEQLQSGDVQP
jgi:excisionase family DNA binding protein